MRHGLPKFGLVAGLLLYGLFAAAQQDSMGKIKSLNGPVFHVIANAGLVAGANDRDLHVQLIPGLQYETWFAGIGTGLDYYYYRSVPLFIDVRKQFKKSIPLFAYADVGWNFPSEKNQQEILVWGYKIDFKKGLYYDIGIGWGFELTKQNKLLFSAGYTGKKFTEIQTITSGTYSETTQEYNLRRIAIKVGFQF